MVGVESLERVDLVLLKVKLLKVGEGFEAFQVLDKVALARDDLQLRQSLESSQRDQLVFGGVELSELCQVGDVLNVADLVVSHVEHCQLRQPFEVLHFADTVRGQVKLL